MNEDPDTIYALSSGFGRAALAVVRMSGPSVPDIVSALAGRMPLARQATLTTFRDPQSGEAIDRGLLIYFQQPRSFTGEDCAEFHLHGGQAVVAALLQSFRHFAHVRPAEPGEFTRRAFENGKLDLTEAEGLADLIDAQTEAQRRQAFRQMDGALRAYAESWRNHILEASALIAAEIDFADEDDVDDFARQDVVALVAPVLQDLRKAMAIGRAGERLRDGLIVVIAGPPNAGKSTLLNVLSKRQAAIVSAIPGTTRDSIEVHLDIEGFPFTLIDTAGLRASDDEIENIGIDLARQKTESADLVLWLSELEAPSQPDLTTRAEIWRILTKADLAAARGAIPSDPDLILSAATGENIETLIARLTGFARTATGEGQAVLITRERHRLAFEAAIAALEPVLGADELPIEILAECLRNASKALEKLIGRVDVEEILGEIFARFCIGK